MLRLAVAILCWPLIVTSLVILSVAYAINHALFYALAFVTVIALAILNRIILQIQNTKNPGLSTIIIIAILGLFLEKLSTRSKQIWRKLKVN